MTKRRILRLLTVFVVTAIALAIVYYFTRERSNAVQHTDFAMDTYVTETLYGTDSSISFEYIKTLESLLSSYDEGSEIYKLNTDGKATLSEDTALIVKEALEYTAQTNGYFDATLFPVTSLWRIGTQDAAVPSDEQIKSAMKYVGVSNFSLDENEATANENSGLDLGGVAKGFACDMVKEMYVENPDITGAVLSFGSSILLYGKPDNKEEFSVALRNPDDAHSSLGTLRLSECFVSTSGGYERNSILDGKKYSHIFDPKTGCPCESEYLSVTVISPIGALGDALSTAVYVGGHKALSVIPEDCSYIIVDKESKIHISKSFTGRFSLTDTTYEVIYE